MKARLLFGGMFAMAFFFTGALFSCAADKNTFGADEGPVKIWAHRGSSARHPENTLEAFKAAAKLPIAGIELDIQLTKDGEIVVIHDETVDRTTNGTGAVKDWTLKDLKKLKIKSASKNPFKKSAGERIPTMREVLELLKPYCKKNGLLINIELKNSRVRYEGMEEKILSLVKEYGLEESVVYSTFNQDSLELLKKLDPSVKTGVLNGSEQVCVDFAARAPVDALHPYVGRLDAALDAMQSGLPVRAWGGAESFFPKKFECEIKDLKRLADAGVTDFITNIPEEYIKSPRRQTPVFELNRSFNYESGVMESSEQPVMADFHFYEVNPGDKIICVDKAWLYQAPFYDERVDESYIHTYCYSPEESWATFTKNINDGTWKKSDTVFDRHGWVRLCAKRADGSPIDASMIRGAQFALRLVRTPAARKANPVFDAGIEDTAKKALALKDKDTLTFALLTDSHYVINGGWEDTASNLLAVNKKAPFDALVHLGDFSDGMTSAAITKEYFYSNLSDLRRLGCPLHLVIGNHDANYFRGNPQAFDEKTQSKVFLARPQPYYYVDYADKKLRLLVLFSFDHTQQGQSNRYGFSDEEVEWTRSVLADMPADYKVIVFSHVPLLAKMHYWSEEIRNEAAMVKVLQDFNAGARTDNQAPGLANARSDNQASDLASARSSNQASGAAGQKGRLLAFVHGHIHADWVNSADLSFPIVSIGCAKVEDDQVKKSAGSTTYSRALGDATQDLWDALVVNTRTGRLDFIRFGAGEDRTLGE
ncbi:MAG: metallophosphoesterase [Clostridiales bacterium]|nr:metallophosphoesterase [Clostridiales bacterium]